VLMLVPVDVEGLYAEEVEKDVGDVELCGWKSR
jgi:hypothetical protein